LAMLHKNVIATQSGQIAAAAAAASQRHVKGSPQATKQSLSTTPPTVIL